MYWQTYLFHKTSQTMGNSEGNMISFIAGLAVGGLLGVLLAPEKGETTRKRIVERSNELRKDLEDQVEAGKKSLSTFADTLASRTKTVGEQAKEAAQDVVEQAKAQVNKN